MTVYASGPGRVGPGPRPGPSALLASVSDGAEARRAIDGGADLIDVTGLPGAAVAAIRAAVPHARLWTGSPDAVDADAVAADAVAASAVDADGVVTDGGVPLAATVAAAAISTWLGAPVIRSRNVLAVRRAIDMTLSIAGDRLPALTTRGLA